MKKGFTLVEIIITIGLIAIIGTVIVTNMSGTLNAQKEELLKLGENIDNVQLETIKGKLANELGVSEDDIVVAPDYNDDAPKGVVRVTKDNVETRYNREGDLFDGENNISAEISDYILNIANTQRDR